jgi:hypothetical protein
MTSWLTAPFSFIMFLWNTRNSFAPWEDEDGTNQGNWVR